MPVQTQFHMFNKPPLQYFSPQLELMGNNQSPIFYPQPNTWNSNASFIPQVSFYNQQQPVITHQPIMTNQQNDRNNPTSLGLTCNYCKEPGHEIRDCAKRAANNARKAELQKNDNGTTQ